MRKRKWWKPVDVHVYPILRYITQAIHNSLAQCISWHQRNVQYLEFAVKVSLDRYKCMHYIMLTYISPPLKIFTKYTFLYKAFYLIDEALQTGKGANTIISLLHHLLQTHAFVEKHLQLHADNCSGQNKNRWMNVHVGCMIYILTNILPKVTPQSTGTWCNTLHGEFLLASLSPLPFPSSSAALRPEQFNFLLLGFAGRIFGL